MPPFLETPITMLAYAIACTAHCEQVDKAGKPYICHPLHIAKQMGDEISTAAALLHDVIEDNPNFGADVLLELKVPAEVVAVVETLTRKEGETYSQYIERVGQNPVATQIKLADLRHNADLSRLPYITKEDLRRQKKYLKAIKQLLGESENR